MTSPLPVPSQPVPWIFGQEVPQHILDRHGLVLTHGCKNPKDGTNPMLRIVGAGPANTLCKTCAHLTTFRSYNGRSYSKCALRENTGSPRTDQKQRWPACALYAPRG